MNTQTKSIADLKTGDVVHYYGGRFVVTEDSRHPAQWQRQSASMGKLKDILKQGLNGVSKAMLAEFSTL